jgi:hypothetical protein
MSERRTLWQDGIEVASVTAQTAEDADREIAHYAMVYGQDGPVEIRNPAVRQKRK